MPNKHFCQGPYCHQRTTQDRFLKSRGVIRGRYALFTMDADNYCERGKYFCSTNCESLWLDEHMKNSITKSKNVDMNPRQSHGKIEAGGLKFKVLGENTSDFKFKIKNKNKNK